MVVVCLFVSQKNSLFHAADKKMKSKKNPANCESDSSSMDATTNTKPSAACLLVKTKTESTPRQRELGCDAFSYYSNKFNRMKTLQLKDDDVEVLHSAGITFQGPAAKRRKGANAQLIQVGGVRQTRLSFEVHASLIFDEDFLTSVHRPINILRHHHVSDDEAEEDEESEDKVKTNVFSRRASETSDEIIRDLLFGEY
jgi:hypothetical protein